MEIDALNDSPEDSWLQLGRLTLSHFDKGELCDGRRLNDNHINFAQALLK